MGRAFIKSVSDMQYADAILVSWVDNRTSDCCTWERIKCNATTGRWTLMTLFVPFQELHVLDLSDNRFEGWEENKAYNTSRSLKQLKILNIGYNSFNESLVPLLTSLTSLTSLFLQRNLEVLDLSGNRITGSLIMQGRTFDSFQQTLLFCLTFVHFLSGILKNLVELNINENEFDGLLPQCLSNLTYLRVLDLSSNKLSGNLPLSVIANLTSLEYLSLFDNHFQGSFPLIETENFPWLPKFQLKVLNLRHCNISGTIPRFLQYQLEVGLPNASSLYVLDVSNNMLSGQLPRWIGNFSNLDVLLMSRNSFEGDVSVQLSNLEVARILDISENKLYGPLEFSSNHSSLRHLFLHNNSLSGTISNALLQSSQLTTLDLRDNEFSGNIPHLINEDSNLRALLLRGNNLQGNIPEPLCHLRKLAIVDISYNTLNGSIPSCFTNISLWMEKEVKFMAKNRYESYKGDVLKYMTALDLSSNELNGDIPSEIGNLGEIHALNLSNNFLSGSIPRSFSNLKMTESMDLSYNKLNGQIPPELGELSFLAIFNVSYNNLSGTVPNKGQFANFDESNYRGNPYLCGPAVRKNCSSELPPTPATSAEEDESAIDMVTSHVNNNLFGGKIGDGLNKANSLNFLDVSNNMVSGQIPHCIGRLVKSLVSSNVESNNETMNLIRHDKLAFCHDE
ncbi:Receptor-like protein 56 [Citrus sinensis]|uniref:Receptor-like protein 56 n=1 Tax=Citrus sinensis TaxID=2711 RepID=A0ACB8JCC9_CITSI|nr:Receptor-like protein 56 [Citrus sinensis]